MRAKTILLIICILIVAQIIFLNLIEKRNISSIEQNTVAFANRIQTAQGEKQDLLRQRENLQSIAKQLPPSILIGFGDPETGLVEFLDYLQSPVLQDAEASFSLNGEPKFIQNPVPLHETLIDFKFDFLQVPTAEKFFNYVLMQKDYPVQVRGFAVKRSPKGKTTGSINAALLIPARIQVETQSSANPENQ